MASSDPFGEGVAIYIYIYIYIAHPISWADLMQKCYFFPSLIVKKRPKFTATQIFPSLIVKNAQNLQPPLGGCKFVFLLSSFALLLPISALFFLFSSGSINLKA